jgi:hypothetical protein
VWLGSGPVWPVRCTGLLYLLVVMLAVHVMKTSWLAMMQKFFTSICPTLTFAAVVGPAAGHFVAARLCWFDHYSSLLALLAASAAAVSLLTVPYGPSVPPTYVRVALCATCHMCTGTACATCHMCTGTAV